jgi:hypothetical protein
MMDEPASAAGRMMALHSTLSNHSARIRWNLPAYARFQAVGLAAKRDNRGIQRRVLLQEIYQLLR